MAYGRSSKGPPNSVSYSQIFMADFPPTSQELVLPDARQETPHHQSETADEIESFCQRHHSKRTLGFKYNFVGRNASYNKVTQTFCMAEQIEVPDVPQVKCAWSISEAITSARLYRSDRIPWLVQA